MDTKRYSTTWLARAVPKDGKVISLELNPNHAKVLQQLGWLYHQPGAPFQNQELAIQYLTKSLEAGNITLLDFLFSSPDRLTLIFFVF